MPFVRRKIYLLGLAAASLASLALFVFLRPHGQATPKNFEEQVRWLQSHPADYLNAGAVTEGALDANSKRRFEVWYAARELSIQLAPWRTGPRMSFVRSGLFHWYELRPRDRADVLRTAAPLLRDPELFHRVAQPLYELTGDFAYLRRNAPREPAARDRLSRIAAMNGLFDEYRSLREEARIARLHRFTQIPSPATQSQL